MTSTSQYVTEPKHAMSGEMSALQVTGRFVKAGPEKSQPGDNRIKLFDEDQNKQQRELDAARVSSEW